MSLLTLNAQAVQVAALRASDVPLGTAGRNAGGQLATAYRGFRRDFNVTTKPISTTDMETLKALLLSGELTAAGTGVNVQGGASLTVLPELVSSRPVQSATGVRHVVEFILHW